MQKRRFSKNITLKGMSKDIDPLNQPQDSYRDARNVVNISEDGDVYSLTNEKGTVQDTFINSSNDNLNYLVIGHVVLDDDVIYFSVSEDGTRSEIGTHDLQGNYTTIVNSDLFAFNIDYPIDAQARKLFNNNRIVYWTDDLNPPRALNLDNVPPGNLDESTELFGSQKIPTIEYVETLESGNLEVGVYQFVVRYLNENFDPLFFGLPSDPIPVVDDIRLDGYSGYDGATIGTNAPKSIVLDINNIDTDYSYLELAVITYTGASSSVSTFITERKQITGNTMRFTFSDKDQSIGELSLDELYLSQPSYNTAKTIEQKDGRLFLGNLTSLPQSIFQELANQIQLKYSVETLESGGTVTESGNSTVSGFELLEVSVESSSPSTLVFTFSEELSAANVDVNRFALLQIDHDGLGSVNSVTRITPNSTTEPPVSVIGNQVFCVFEGVDITSLELQEIDNAGVDYYTYGFGSDLDTVPTVPVVTGTQDVISTSSATLTEVSNTYDPITSTLDSNGSDFIAFPSALSDIGDNSQKLNSFTDYKDEGIASSKKTYKRGEVYSFGIQVIFKNGALGPVNHIPGNDRALTYDPSDVSNNKLNGAGNLLGTYVSEDLYPTDGGYPSNSGSGSGFSDGSSIRHHLIPTQDKEPIIDSNGDLRIISINPVWDDNGTERTILDLINSNPQVKASVSGFIIVRQKRDKATHTSKVMQGVAMNMWRHQGAAGEVGAGAGAVGSHTYISPNYLLGKTAVSRDGSEDRVRFLADGTGTRGFGNAGDQINDLAAFYSPENIFLKEQADSGTRIKTVGKLTGGIQRTRTVPRDTVTNGSSGTSDSTEQKGGGVHVFCSYDSLDVSNLNSFQRPTILNSANTKFNSASHSGGSDIFDRGFSQKLRNYFNEGYLLLDLTQSAGDTTGDLPESGLPREVFYGVDRNASNVSFTNGGNSERYLYDIERELTNQYGSLGSSEYVPIAVYSDLDTVPVNLNLFGGDTFISYVAFKNRNMLPYRWRWKNSWFNNGHVSQVNNADDPSFLGEQFSAIFHFPVESKVNCNYRHVLVDANGNTGVTYYPRVGGDNLSDISKSGGPLRQSPALGEADGYNLLYSKENEVGVQSSVPLGFEEVVEFPNRVIYSQRSFEGERSDQYRFFLANSTHDIPKHSGEIWDMFTHNGKLWLHTEKSLWRTYVNERTAVASSTGELFLGNGGLFPLPSQEVFTVEGGHAGTTSQWGNVKTPYGYFWVDQRAGKLFKLTEGVEEVSTKGVKRFFEQNFKLPSKVDNPFNPTGSGLVIGYDKRYSRLLITNSRVNTVSLSLLTNTFVSQHDYAPSKYISQDDRMFSITNTSHEVTGLPVWEHNIGEYCTFYGNLFNMEWVGVISDLPDQGKTFDNLFLVTDCYDETQGVYDMSETFDQIQVYNETQNSDVLTLDPSQSTTGRPLDVLPISLVRNGEYRISTPRDLVLDTNLPIDLASNLATVDPVLYANTIFPRIKGRYIIVKFIYSNSTNKRLTFKNLISGMRINFI